MYYVVEFRESGGGKLRVPARAFEALVLTMAFSLGALGVSVQKRGRTGGANGGMDLDEGFAHAGRERLTIAESRNMREKGW